MERILRPTAMRRGVGERPDHVPEKEHLLGHPWVRVIGRAFGCMERTWWKWMLRPSIVVRNCGKPLSAASHLHRWLRRSKLRFIRRYENQ
jgi:hypothetical protein